MLSDRLGINEVKLKCESFFVSRNSHQEGIEEWIKTTDFDGDKRITFEEFKYSVCGNSLIDLSV